MGITHKWNGTVLTITSDSGTSSCDLQGEKGDTGIRGPQGVAGIDGRVTFEELTEEQKASLKGATGATGPKGEDGKTPVKGVDYYTALEKAEFEALITDEMVKRAQIKPEFANSIKECTDTSKFYVLPDGYIYAYLYKEASGPTYTNLAGAVMENTRQNSSGVAKALDGAITTDFIPVKQGDTVRLKGFNPKGSVNGNYPYIAFFTAASESAVVATDKIARGDGCWNLNGDVYEYTPFKLQSNAEHSLASSITHIRVNGAMTGSAADVIVTVNEEIVENTAGGYAWSNTGHAFATMNYESRIIELEETVVNHEDRLDNLETNIENLLPKKWEGKKWVVVGDSLTQALNSDGTNANTDKYYHTHIAEETGITVVNMGQGGTGYKKTDDAGYAFYQRIVNVPTDADVITILGSLNDLSRTAGYTIGEITDTGTETICGCINTTLDTLFSLCPTVNLGIITPVPNDYYNYPNMATDERTLRVIEYCEKLTEICHRRSIPVLDMFHGSGMRPWDVNFKNALMPDGTHANEEGHKILATKIKAFLESLL